MYSNPILVLNLTESFLQRNQFLSLGRAAVFRELSAGVRKSETVALRNPVMPVGNGFGGRIVGINSGQL